MKQGIEAVFALAFPVFIAGKVVGTFAAWSWWWLLMPIVPCIGEVLLRYAR